MLNNILYATDLGLFGPFILEHVCDLAVRHKAKVTVVHAVEPVGMLADALLETYVPEKDKVTLKNHGYDAVMATIRARVLQAFEDDFIDFNGPRGQVQDVRVVPGEASSVILQEAEKIGVDLIVLGTHGNGSGITSLGSVASKVLQLSTVPIYLVPTRAKARTYSSD